MSRKLIVEIIGDDKSVQRAFTRSTASANKFGLALGKVEKQAVGAQGFLAGKGAAAGFAGAAGAAVALRFLDQSADAASALEEQVSKSRVVLGDASKTVEEFGRISAESFGISNRAAVEAASSLAGLFTTVGLGQKRAADLGVELTRLSGDLASFFDTSTDEALTALRSGLVGESEPLRRFNVLLSEARVQQEAFAQTGKKTAAALTEQDKVLARIALIFRSTSDAQGDAARTADTLANKQRRLTAELEDTRANVGKLVVPIKTELVGALSDALTVTNALVDGLDRLGAVKIPPIKIPFIIDIGDGTAAGLLGDFRELGGPSGPEKLARFLGDQFKTAYNKAAKEANQNLLRGSPFQIPLVLPDVKVTGGAAKGTKQAGDNAKDAAAEFGKFMETLNKYIDKSIESALATAKNAQALKQLEAATETAALAVDQVSLALERAQGTATLRDDIAAYKQIGKALDAQEKALIAQIALDEDNASLKRELVAIQAAQIQNENAMSAAVKERAQTQKDAANQAVKDADRIAKKQREEALAAKQRQQFRALGLQPTGEELVPTAKNLRDRLGNITEAVRGTFLDTSKTRSLLQRIRKVLSGEFGAITQESRQAIREMLDGINDDLNGGTDGPLTKFHKANAKKILAGIDFASIDDFRQAQSRISQIGSGGTINQGSLGGAFGQNVGQPITIQNDIIIDGQVVASTVTKHQDRAGARNGGSRRGTHPGRVGGV